jgi:uncharacterized protein (TIGR02001 family)
MKKVVAIILAGSVLSVSSIAQATVSSTDQATRYKNAGLDAKTAPAATVKKEPEGELTGNFDFTSNYVFRGISQSDNLPAVQGSFNYEFTRIGLYFNLWGSNVRQFYETDEEEPVTKTATIELDTLMGIKNNIGENFSYDFGMVRYNYPKATRLNYNELLLNLTYKIFFGKFGYSPNVFNSHGVGTSYSGGINVDIPSKYVFNINEVSICGSAGFYDLPKRAGNSYHDYSLTLNKKINNYTLSAAWTQTDGRNQTAPLDDDHLIFTALVDF